MRGWVWIIAVSMALGACGSPDAQMREDMDALTRRVQKLERRLQTLENRAAQAMRATKGGKAKGKARGKGGKAKGGKAKGGKAKGGKAAGGPKGAVEVAGDAERVVLSRGKRRFPVPGEVPAGDYRVMAKFDADGTPVEAGNVKVSADSTVQLSCAASTQTCTAGG